MDEVTVQKQGAISLADWHAEFARRGKLDAKFICPSCENEASPNDFKAAGADPQRAPHECIGRVDPKLGGCDWAAFGLIDICPVHIVMADPAEGDRGDVPVFAFGGQS